MGLRGFEKLNSNTILAKSKSVKKGPQISKRGLSLIDKIKAAEEYVYKKLGHFKDVYKCLYTFQEVQDYFSDLPREAIIGLDTETDGLDTYKNNVIGICLKTDNKPSVYVPVNHIDPMTGERLINQVKPEEITQIFNTLITMRPDLRFIYHNAEFDVRIMIHNFKLSKKFIDMTHWDTLIVAHCINENKEEKRGLKELHLKYCPGPNETEVLEFMDLFPGVPYAFIKPEAAKLYAAGDADKTIDVYKWQLAYLDQPGNEKFKECILNIEVPTIAMTLRMEEHGVLIDQELLNKLDQEYIKEIEDSEKACYEELEKFSDKITAYRIKNKGKKTDKIDDPLKIGSPAQIKTFLYKICKIKDADKMNKAIDTREEETTSEDADKKMLEKIGEKHKDLTRFIDNLLAYRHATKMKATYIDAIRERIQDDGRIHATFGSRGTVTGRYSCKNPNLQNIPKEAKLRGLFYGGNKYYIGGADFSKQEVFITTEETGDPELVKVFAEGKDIYGVLASTVYDLPYHECLEFQLDPETLKPIKDANGAKIENVEGHERRSMGKTGWLGLTYGMGGQGLANKANEGLEEGEEPMTKDKADEILGKIKGKFKVAFDWIDKTHKFVREHGFVENMYGARRHLPEIKLPRFTIDFMYDAVTGKQIMPTCYEDDPLDFTPTVEKVVKLEEIPASVYVPYIKKLEKAYNAGIAKSIITEFEKKEKLTIHQNGDKIARAERQSVNSKIQGDAACVMKNVMLALDRDEKLKEWDTHPIITVHDEILVEVSREHYKEAMLRVKEIMIGETEKKIKLSRVKVDPVLAERWYGEKPDSPGGSNEIVVEGLY